HARADPRDQIGRERGRADRESFSSRFREVAPDPSDMPRVPERLAQKELHRNEELLSFLAELVDLDDVRVIELRDDPGLVEEHVHEVLIFGVRRLDHLERVKALEASWTGEPTDVDARHSAVGDLPPDFVAPEARRKTFRHVVRAG